MADYIPRNIPNGHKLTAEDLAHLEAGIAGAYNYTDSVISDIQAGGADLTGYATDDELTAGTAQAVTDANTYTDTQIDAIPLPDLTGYATETYVDDAVGAIPTPDLTGYATESYVTTTVSDTVRSPLLREIVPVPEGDPLPPLADNTMVVRYFVPGTLYYSDFSAETTGAAPSEWTPQWKTLSAHTIKDDATATGGKVLSISTTTNERFGIAWNALDADPDRNNVEILFRSKTIGAGNSLPTAVGRGSGANLTETAYRGGGRALANRTVSKYVGGAYTDLLSDAYTIAADTWYMTRFRINGSTLSLRVWQDGVAEPTNWLTVTDNSITAAGWVGLALTSNPGERQVDWVAAGTAGRTAAKL